MIFIQEIKEYCGSELFSNGWSCLFVSIVMIRSRISVVGWLVVGCFFLQKQAANVNKLYLTHTLQCATDEAHFIFDVVLSLLSYFPINLNYGDIWSV